MRHQYLMIDSRGNPVAHGTSDDGLEKSVWEIQVDSGDIKRVLSHEYVSLVSSSEKVPAMEGRIIRRDGNIISVESVRRLGEDVRRNLRMPVRFESYLYPVSGEWKGRLPILSNDLSCGGISFFLRKDAGGGRDRADRRADHGSAPAAEHKKCCGSVPQGNRSHCLQRRLRNWSMRKKR